MNKAPTFVFALLALLSLAAVGFAFYYRALAGVFIYDSNFDTFHSVLTAEQERGIMRSVENVTSVFIFLLVGMNLLWLSGGAYLLRRSRRHVRLQS